MAKKHNKKKKKKKQLSISSSNKSVAYTQQAEADADSPSYDSMSIQELLSLCAQHKLLLKEEQLLKQYQKEHDVYLLYLAVMEKTDPASQLDSRAIFTLLEKILDKYFTLSTIPDSYYIQRDARILEHTSKDQAEYIIETADIITDRLINFSFITGTDNFKRFITTYRVNLAALLVDAYDHLVLLHPDEIKVHQTIRTVKKLCSSYPKETAFHEDMYALILKWYGYLNAKDEIEELRTSLLKQYPNEPYFIHYALISGLSYGKHMEQVEYYGSLARKYMLFSTMEQQLAKEIENIKEAVTAK